MHNIMIIDDSQTIRKTADLFLNKDYKVISVTDGFAGLTEIYKIRPDVIFVDIDMPHLNGFEFCRLVKEHEEFKDIPIVILSAKDSPFDKVKGKMAGADEYLTKPFKKEHIIDTIKKFFPK